MDSEFLTKKMSSIPRCKDAANYIHSRPVQGDASFTCVLEDGSRVFLRRMKTNTSTSSDQQDSSRIGGSLLSKSMKDLLKEAKDLQVANLAAKARKDDALIFQENYMEEEVDLGSQSTALADPSSHQVPTQVSYLNPNLAVTQLSGPLGGQVLAQRVLAATQSGEGEQLQSISE